MKTSTATALASAALLSLASAQEQYSISPDSVSEDNRKYWCQNQITQCPVSRYTLPSNGNPLTFFLPADLPATAFRDRHNKRQHLRLRHSSVLLRVRRRPQAQRHPVHPDTPLLHLPRVGQPVRDCLQRRQRLLVVLPRGPPLRCPRPHQTQLFHHQQHHVLQRQRFTHC